MTNPLLLIGGLGGSGVEVIEMAQELGYEPINGIWDSSEQISALPTFLISDLSSKQRAYPTLIVGHRRYLDLVNARLDRRWCESTARVRQELENLGVNNWVSLHHSSATVSPSAQIGVGVIIGPGVTVSSMAVIGDFVSVGRSSSVGHHSRVGDYSRLGPGVIIPGDVAIGSKVVVGPSATFVNGLRISDAVLIGAGSVVTRHIRGPAQVMGNPARPLRRPVSLIRRAAKRAVFRLLRTTGLYSRARQWYRRTFS